MYLSRWVTVRHSDRIARVLLLPKLALVPIPDISITIAVHRLTRTTGLKLGILKSSNGSPIDVKGGLMRCVESEESRGSTCCKHRVVPEIVTPPSDWRRPHLLRHEHACSPRPIYNRPCVKLRLRSACSQEVEISTLVCLIDSPLIEPTITPLGCTF